MIKKECSNCHHLHDEICPAAFKSIDGCGDFCPRSNGDRIRSMSDKELANLFVDADACPSNIPLNSPCKTGQMAPRKKCIQCWLIYLNIEVKK